MSTSEQIVYQQAERLLAQQQRSVDELRTRTSIVLTATALTTAFLGQAAIEDGVGIFGVFAFLFLGAGVLLCLWVLLPKFDSWTFDIGAHDLIRRSVLSSSPGTPSGIYLYIAYWMETYYWQNNKVLAHLFVAFWWACIFLAVQVSMWLFELAID